MENKTEIAIGQRVHVILPTGLVENEHLDTIKKWMRDNPTTEIIVWYDSLAYYLNTYLDECLEKSPDLNRGDWLCELLSGNNEHSLEFEHFNEFRRDLLKEIMEQDLKPQLAHRINNGVQEIFEKLPLQAHEVNEIREKLKKCIENNGTNNHAFIHNGLHSNFEAMDIYEHFNSSNEYLLYWFEILRNKDVTLAKSLAIYMISKKFQGELVTLALNQSLLDQIDLYSLTLETQKLIEMIAAWPNCLIEGEQPQKQAVNYLIFQNDSTNFDHIEKTFNNISGDVLHQIKIFNLHVIQNEMFKKIIDPIREEGHNDLSSVINHFHEKFPIGKTQFTEFEATNNMFDFSNTIDFPEMDSKSVSNKLVENIVETLPGTRISRQTHFNEPQPPISELVSNAELFSETLSMAHDLQNAYQDLLHANPEQITTDHVPVFETLTELTNGNETYWQLSLMDSNNPSHPTITVQTKAPIFKKIGSFIKSIALNPITTTLGSSSLNLAFGIKAICYWIENGFESGDGGLTNENLIKAMHVHFYINATGIIQGFVDTGLQIGLFSVSKGLQSIPPALLPNLIETVAPFIRMSSTKILTKVDYLLKMGNVASKGLSVLGLVVSGLDLGFNIYELTQDDANDSPYRRPLLITNTVFSAAGFTVSIAATAALVLGASAAAGPLALVGLGIAVVSIAVNALVNCIIERIEGAKIVGSVIKSIVNEIKNGAYTKNVEQKYLMAPSFVAIKKLILSSSVLEIEFGKMNYVPSEYGNGQNRFTKWYHPNEECSINNGTTCAKLSIDNNYRTLIMPHIPGYTLKMSDKLVPFTASRNDAEFQAAIDLQKHDSGFKFQTGRIGAFDSLADTLTFDYEFETRIDVMIQENNWHLIFPWGDTSLTENQREKELLTESNNKTIEHLDRIAYNIIAECSGEQMISLPALECPIALHLNSNHKDVTWLIHFDENSVSNKDILIGIDHVQIGEKQHIKMDRKNTKVYIVIPNYQDSDNQYHGIAHYDVTHNHYIYNKDANPEEQKYAKLFHSNYEFAYYLSPVKDQNTMNLWTLRCISIKTKEVVLKHDAIKSFQKQENGLVIVDNSGIIYHISKDFRSIYGLVSLIIGFTSNWFDQRQENNFEYALYDIYIVHLYLPYYISDDKSLDSSIWFYPDKEKYLILDHNENSMMVFLKFDPLDKNAYFYAKSRKQLVSVKGLSIQEMAQNLQVKQGKTQIYANEPCKVLFDGVENALIAEKGVQIQLSCGLVFLFYTTPKHKSQQIQIDIEKLILDENDQTQFDKTTQNVLQEKLITLEKEHFGELIKEQIKINQSDLIAIAYKGKDVGFYETKQQRTLCAAVLPTANRIQPLGSFQNYVFDILDGRKLYQSQSVSLVSEILNGPKTQTTQTKLLCEAESLEFFNQTLHVKNESITNDFWNALKTLSNLKLRLIWIGSKNFHLNLGQFENATIASHVPSLNTSKNIQIQIDKTTEYYLQRENWDLVLKHPKNETCFIVSGVFKSGISEGTFDGVSIHIDNEEMNVFNMPNTYKLSTLINKYSQNNLSGTNPQFILRNLLEGVNETTEIVENVIRTFLWPDANKKVQVYTAMEWFDMNSNSNKSEQFLAYLKNYPDVLKNLVETNRKSDNILNLAFTENKYDVLHAIFRITTEIEILRNVLFSKLDENVPKTVENTLEEIKTRIETNLFKTFILKIDDHGNNILNYVITNCLPKDIDALLKTVKNNTGTEILQSLILNVNKSKKNILEFIVFYKPAVIGAFMKGVKDHCGAELLEELLLKKNANDQVALVNLTLFNSSKAIEMLLNEMKVHLGVEKLERLMLNVDNEGNNILSNMCFDVKPEVFETFVNALKIHLGTDILKKLVLNDNKHGKNILDISTSENIIKITEFLLKCIIEHFGKKTLEELMMRADTFGLNVLENSVGQSTSELIQTLLGGISEHLGEEVLKKFVTKTNDDGNYVLIILASHNKHDKQNIIGSLFEDIEYTVGIEVLELFGQNPKYLADPNLTITPEFIVALLVNVANNLGTNVLEELLSKTDKDDNNILICSVLRNKPETIMPVFKVIREYLKLQYLYHFISKTDKFSRNILVKIGLYDKSEIIEPLFNAINYFFGPESLKKLVLKNGARDQTILSHPYIEAKSIEGLMQAVKFHLGTSTLSELVLQENRRGYSALVWALYQKPGNIEALMIGVKQHLGRETLEKLILLTDLQEKSILGKLISMNNPEMIETLFNLIEKHTARQTLEKLVFQVSTKGGILHEAVLANDAKNIELLLTGVMNYLGSNALQTLTHQIDNFKKTAVESAIFIENFTAAKALLDGIKIHLGTDAFNELLADLNKKFGKNKIDLLGYTSI